MTYLDKHTAPVCVASVQEILRGEGSVELVEGYLMNRRTVGTPLRIGLMRKLNELAQSSTLAVDLTGIIEMTTSVAEEIGPMLFRELVAYRDKGNEIFMTYSNASPEIANGLDAAFSSWPISSDIDRRFTVVVFGRAGNGHFSDYQFVGKEVPEALRTILDLIYARGHALSSDIEQSGIKAASRKLNELYKQYPWLIRRVQRSVDTGSRAWAYFYYPIVATTAISMELAHD